jgi:uncharacterized protein
MDSLPFQRLRGIHQLALTYYVYPGATHRRFEHSLGVMELASRIFDVVTDPANLESSEAREVVPPDRDELGYWRRVLRAAALFHDVGHLPFSHAAEDRLLPSGWDHERISRELILCEEMKDVWMGTTPPLRADHIAAVAVEPPGDGTTVPAWIAILREMITGSVLGADRMDYLLRDSHHIGVAYGRFDHHRLVNKMRILRPPAQGSDEEQRQEQSSSPELGIEDGGLQTAEALLLARYAMFSQVYFHRTRRIYDLHLADFLEEWLPKGGFATDVDGHLRMTDERVQSAIEEASAFKSRGKRRIKELASRILDRRERYRLLYGRELDDVVQNADIAKIVARRAAEKFGKDAIRFDSGGKSSSAEVFPVQERAGRIVASSGASEVLSRVPESRYEYVFVKPSLRDDALTWLREMKDSFLGETLDEEGDG